MDADVHFSRWNRPRHAANSPSSGSCPCPALRGRDPGCPSGGQDHARTEARQADGRRGDPGRPRSVLRMSSRGWRTPSSGSPGPLRTRRPRRDPTTARPLSHAAGAGRSAPPARTFPRTRERFARPAATEFRVPRGSHCLPRAPGSDRSMRSVSESSIASGSGAGSPAPTLPDRTSRASSGGRTSSVPSSSVMSPSWESRSPPRRAGALLGHARSLPWPGLERRSSRVP